MFQYDVAVAKACTIVYSCLHGNGPALRQHLPLLVESLLSLASSPLAAPHVTELYIKLNQCAFWDTSIDKYFGKSQNVT